MLYYEGLSISNASYFFSPLLFKKTQIQLHSLKITTLKINLSLFNIIAVHFHRFGPPFNKGMYSSPVRQRSVIEFLTAEGEMPIGISERLKNVYGDAAVDVSTFRRWFIAVKKLKDLQSSLTPCVNALGGTTLFFTGLEYMPLLKGGPKRWKWTEIIYKSDTLIVKDVVFRPCNFI